MIRVWIAPTGEVLSQDNDSPETHLEIAETIFPAANNPELAMEKEGYVKILQKPSGRFAFLGTVISQKQAQTITDLALQYPVWGTVALNQLKKMEAENRVIVMSLFTKQLARVNQIKSYKSKQG